MKLCKFDFLTSSTRLQDPMHMTNKIHQALVSQYDWSDHASTNWKKKENNHGNPLCRVTSKRTFVSRPRLYTLANCLIYLLNKLTIGSCQHGTSLSNGIYQNGSFGYHPTIHPAKSLAKWAYFYMIHSDYLLLYYRIRDQTKQNNHVVLT